MFSPVVSYGTAFQAYKPGIASKSRTLGASIISISTENWPQVTNPYEAQDELAKRNGYNILGFHYTKGRPPLDDEPIIVFRFKGGLLVGEAKFDRWDKNTDNRFWYKSFRRYQNVVAQKDLVRQTGDFVYPKLSDKDLEKVRKEADRKEEGAYVSTGETEGLTSHRIGQGEVRTSALRRYYNKCALCEICNPSLLVAGHVKDWKKDKMARGRGDNVILMCALHDSLFGKGLMMINPKTKKVEFYSEKLTGFLEQIKGVTQKKLRIVDYQPPAAKYLRWHVENVFRK